MICPGLTAVQGRSAQCQCELSYRLCERIGQFSVAEKQEFETQMGESAAKKMDDVFQCSRCMTYLYEPGTGSQVGEKVACPGCYSQGQIFNFCSKCKCEWTKSVRVDGLSREICASQQCTRKENEERNRILRECGIKRFGVHSVPAKRACPKPSCNCLIEHESGCNEMICK